jgi:amino acid transporter
MKRLFYLTFGVLAVLIGFTIAVWLFYNLLIERQPEFTGIWTPAQLFMPFVMIGCGIHWLRKGLKSSNVD